MTVAVLIVNWNGGDWLRRCLESLHSQSRRPDHIVVVDNASTDQSLEAAANALADAQVIRLDENVGFARANNIGARAARAYDGLALLNPDALPHAGWLEALIDAAERHPSVAAFASQLRLASAPRYLDGVGDSYHVSGRAWRDGHRTLVADWPAADREVFAACAAAALYRRAAFEEVGGFDEQYFCYFEDVDLGFRLRLRGYRCLYVHRAIVDHEGSATSGYRSDFTVYHGERNAVWTYMKDMPTALLLLYLPHHIAVNLAALIYYPWRGQGRVVLKAKIDALRGARSVLKRRRLVQRTRLVGAWTIRRSLTKGVTSPYIARYRSRLAALHTEATR